MRYLRVSLVLAMAAGLAGCIIEQRPKGVFQAEDLPPPPSEKSLREQPAAAEDTKSPTKSRPAHQRLAVPPAAR